MSWIQDRVKTYGVAAGLFAAGIALSAALAARVSAAKTDDARKEWKKDWGPLVPHKTFPKDCALCHLPKRWDKLRADFKFDHAKETGYPLEGAHASAACLRCHNDRGPVQAYVSRGCAGCHVDPHKSSLGMDCARCHTQNTWRVQSSASEQHARTRFPLTGAHQSAACEQCHTRASTGEFKGAPTECSLCHQKEFASAPNHASMRFPQNCSTCHTSKGWSDARFNHDLVGGNSGSCLQCHQADYQRAPNHIAMRFPQNCASCHTTASWKGARFDHNIVGGTSANCIQCHQADYQRGPNHVAMGFSENCATCHTLTAWTGANFTHRFPLQGPHNVTCNSCHTGGNTQSFNCLACHAAATTNEHHKEVAGYSYNSQSCYTCHTNGRAP